MTFKNLKANGRYDDVVPCHNRLVVGISVLVCVQTTDRHVFLLDGLLLCCKLVRSFCNCRITCVLFMENLVLDVQQPVTRKSLSAECRLKEKFSVRRLEVFDREDSDGVNPMSVVVLRCCLWLFL